MPRFEHPNELQLLAQPVQEWVLRTKQWTKLWPIQCDAIHALSGDHGDRYDLILCAPTAGGKTAAALMPLLSRISHKPKANSFEILFVSPLRALIRQQGDAEGDVATLAAAAGGRNVHRWMGDIPPATKNNSWAKPEGILLITPESLESIFVHRSREIAERFSALTAIVVDELHAYFDSPRGAQLVSLLARLDARLDRRRPLQRIALSATLGDGSKDAIARLYAFLRPGSNGTPKRVLPAMIDLPSGESLLDIHITAETDASPMPSVEPAGTEHPPSPAQAQIVKHLRHIFLTDAAKKGLIFTNSRHAAESYARWLDKENLPQMVRPVNTTVIEAEEQASGEDEENATASGDANTDVDDTKDQRCFRPHHGSLNRKARETAESRMRNPDVRSVLVCTTTLELGIDIGAIEEVAQIGPGATVASLRQRLGRSGRLALLIPDAAERQKKGVQPRLHIFLREAAIDENASPLERLRLQIFQTFAQVELLRQKNFEAPNPLRLDASTLVQQIVSLIYEHREEGITIKRARAILTKVGPFGPATAPLYREDAYAIFDATLNRLATRHPPLIDFDHVDGLGGDDRELFLTPDGERIINNHLIYTAFRTPVEYTVRSVTRVLGSAALAGGFSVGDKISFNGRAWEVSEVSHTKRIVYVRPAESGRAVHFLGDAIPASQSIIDRMKELYGTADRDFEERLARLGKLNPNVKRLAREGREAFAREGLASSIVPIQYKSPNLWILPWLGVRRLNGLYLLLRWARLPVVRNGLALIILDRAPEEVAEAIQRSGLLPGTRGSWPDMMELVRFAGGTVTGKFDHFLNPSLRRADFMRAQLELEGVPACLEALVRHASTPARRRAKTR